MTTPQEPQPKTALSDPDNVLMEVVEEGTGYTVEDAYRVLAELPVQTPTPVQPEE